MLTLSCLPHNRLLSDGLLLLLLLFTLVLGWLPTAQAHGYGNAYGGGYHHGYGRVMTPRCPPPTYGAYGGGYGQGYNGRGLHPLGGANVWVQPPRPVVIVQPRIIQSQSYYTTPRGFATQSYANPSGFTPSGVVRGRLQGY